MEKLEVATSGRRSRRVIPSRAAEESIAAYAEELKPQAHTTQPNGRHPSDERSLIADERQLDLLFPRSGNQSRTTS